MGEEQPLLPVSAQGNVEPLVCPTCRTQYNVPIDD
jgi:hypothetical protein